jgi:hypothetical protein
VALQDGQVLGVGGSRPPPWRHPYFWQAPAERHLYGPDGEGEEDVFPVPALRCLLDAWKQRSPERRDANAELVRELLPQSPVGLSA